MDGGIPLGVLSEHYDNFYWNRGENDILKVGHQQDPRVVVHQDNFSLIIQDSRLCDGETYIWFVDVEGSHTKSQRITLLSYSKYAHCTLLSLHMEH